MKQSFDSVFAIEDIEVANIMLELPRLMLRPPRFSCTWGCRRKRSVCTSSPPPSKQPLPSSTVVGPIEKVLSSSPDTPLSFCSNEADEKSLPLPPKKKASSVNSLKRKKEQFLETVEDFTHRNEILKKDIEIKRQLLDRQIAENLELKSKKLKLNQSLLTPETHKSLNLGIQSTQMSVGQHHQQQGIPSRVHHQPLMMDQMVQMISLLPSSNSIPDLNVSAEEAFIDLDIVNKSRAAAEARFKRKQICRAKNFKSLYKAGCPLT
ncbi:Dihydroxy-acid dehydratase 1 [Gossypium arboreum]|uniref:Dihydroxy-acid dehydratase 1 n=4 Tax=Gossypium TaxID=3633 RepID=A0A0B0NRA9_GOSAR|nr:uncharacterized protein LOC108459567 [Gossypium arboreum]KAK5823770.1 hypothetical protein PVK06_018533 [Gossypium arboreum]KHG14304.1 Dihydroxy-acid dehydratase 1 [Gossypium arboreum]PPS07837.1 hypothetical protein GOBAR_AA12796 [Gossypium barbadense]TYJ28502.1 hypothetical protein E1A91_A06G003900v1 [Gossypium mustelinum]